MFGVITIFWIFCAEQLLTEHGTSRFLGGQVSKTSLVTYIVLYMSPHTAQEHGKNCCKLLV